MNMADLIVLGVIFDGRMYNGMNTMKNFLNYLGCKHLEKLIKPCGMYKNLHFSRIIHRSEIEV